MFRYWFWFFFCFYFRCVCMCVCFPVKDTMKLSLFSDAITNRAFCEVDEGKPMQFPDGVSFPFDTEAEEPATLFIRDFCTVFSDYIWNDVYPKPSGKDMIISGLPGIGKVLSSHIIMVLRGVDLLTTFLSVIDSSGNILGHHGPTVRL